MKAWFSLFSTVALLLPGATSSFTVLPSIRSHCRTPSCPTTTRTTIESTATGAVPKHRLAVARKDVNGDWFPRETVAPGRKSSVLVDEAQPDATVEAQAVALAAELVREHMQQQSYQVALVKNLALASPRLRALVQNRFQDLACREEGERLLENLFATTSLDVEAHKDNVIRGAVMVFQSLCVYATQVGVKGTEEQLKRMVAHLDPRRNPSLMQRDLRHWDADSVRRLKFQLDSKPAIQLLSKLLWKRSTQGAFDLLVAIGAWEKHEDIALLRSGFPLRFSQEEQEAAEKAAYDVRDPDTLLNIRRDLRHMKIYTIDSASTTEVDDGLSVEVITKESGEKAHRFWIHIADADRWAPRGSRIFQTARTRINSLYLPRCSISMVPPSVATDLMSLEMRADSNALSLGIEVNADGSIDESTIVVTSSLVRVSYRLTYDEVDEMFDEGIAYAEEWELGALLELAQRRRQFRIKSGSTEGMIPNPIPYFSISTYTDKNAPDEIGISLRVEVSHNAGRNQTAEDNSEQDTSASPALPVSSSSLLVTEAMIMAGEAMGRWKQKLDRQNMKEKSIIPHRIRLPYRTQRAPAFRARPKEYAIMQDLKNLDVGGGLCYSWYARRFLSPVNVTEVAMPHAGLGLECYVQWSSPIRRFSDLQVHGVVKRLLRRQRLNKLLSENGAAIPADLLPGDFGFPANFSFREITKLSAEDIDRDVNFFEELGLIGVSRNLQRRSSQYWLFQYIDRLIQRDPETIFTAVVLGCVNPTRQQYAIYVYELGLEHRYLSVGLPLDPGTRLRLIVDAIYPRTGLLTFVRVV